VSEPRSGEGGLTTGVDLHPGPVVEDVPLGVELG